MKNNKFIILMSLTVIMVLTVLGFEMKQSSITNFYYYKDKPLNVDLRTDKIFIKTKQQLTKEELRSNLSVYPEVSGLTRFDNNQNMQFVDLNKSMSSSELIDFISTLNKNSNIEYSSPVFSPREGEGNTKVLQGVTDEILVQFKQNTSKDIIKSYLLKNDFSIVQSLDLGGGTAYVLNVPQSKGMFTIDAANMVYKDGLVNWAEPNFYYSGLLTYAPNDVFYPRQWSIRNLGNNVPEGIAGTAGCDMRVDSAWNITLGIPQCVVGMVDSGIDTTHEDIRANLLNAKGWDFINGHALQTDDMNHGTCTGGIVAAVGNNSIGISGIAPSVKLIGIKIFNAAGSTTTAALTNGLVYSWQQGEWISSNSWGGGSPVSAADQAILDGVTLGRNGKGTVFCVATGNSNGALQWPSTNANVISVGGNSPCNQRKSTGSCDGETWWGANYGTGMYIVAPCVKVYATDRMGGVGYTNTNYDSAFNGTSSATPNAAGVCALALSLDSTMRWDTLRVRLSRTADKIGSYTYTSAGPSAVLGNTWNNEMGYGKINAYRLLQSTQQMMGPVISHTPLGNTEQTTGTRAVNAVINPAAAPIVSSLTKIFYLKLPAVVYDSVQMTNSSGSNWTANITLSGAGTYRYYVRTGDNIGRISYAPFGAPTTYYSFTSSPDTVKPVISTTPIPNTPKATWPVSVTATVTDNIGVDSAWVVWRINSGVNKRFKLINTSGSIYSALFNSVNGDVVAGNVITYRVFAQDNSSNHNRDSSASMNFTIINLTTSCIGNGTVQMGSASGPFNTYWYGNRTNILWTSAEIIANGGAIGNITRVGFDIATVGGQAMTGLTYRFQNTTATSLTGFVSTGWTTAYSNTYTVSGTGIQYIDLTTPFYWNGTNLMMEICFQNTSYSTATVVNGTTITGMEYTEYHDLSTACSYTGFTAPTAQTARANVCFVIAPITGVNPIGNTIPTVYSLAQNYPNPFNPVTKINFALPKQGFVTLKIYDVLGREVRTLVNEVKSAGQFSVDFNASDYSSGVYFYRLESNGFSDIKRMVLIK
jgi:hypothetical protein